MPVSSKAIPFKQVDVFTDVPFRGNPVAVVLDATGLDAEQMQRIAAWTNLSETTFALPSDDCDYRLRIFTPIEELPFAGHPTIGSAHALLEAGIVTPTDGRLRQECGAGVIELTVADDGAITARVPTPKVVRAEDAEHVAALAGQWSLALGASFVEDPAPALVDVGPVWLIAQIAGPEALGALSPDFSAIEALGGEGSPAGATVFAFAEGEDAAVRVRSFAPGIGEDPVCGSGNASVGAYLAVTGLLDRTGQSYTASQGREMGRDGRVSVVIAAGEVSIGGHAVTVIDGEIRL